MGTGYRSRAYAEAFSEFGSLLTLPQSGGHLLRRRIPGTTQEDAGGLYPLFCCGSWQALREDLRTLDDDLPSLVLSPDPFGNYTPALLADTFDIVRPHRERYIVEFDRKPEQIVSTHHRKQAMRSLEQLAVETCTDPAAHLDEWITLYSQVCRRHQISDIRAFSPESFRRQLSVPGLTMFRARHAGHTVAIHLWMQHDNAAYGHLAGHDDAAYGLQAAYALYWHALTWFQDRVARLDLGASTGPGKDGRDGLAYFKKGWATGTRMGYICGRILQPAAYAALTAARHPEPTPFFPAYRAATPVVDT